MHIPHLPVALLVEVHPHHQGLTQTPSELHKLLPGGVMAQDIAHHHLSLCLPGSGNHPFGPCYRGGERLFDKQMTSRRQRRQGVGFVGVRISGQAHGIRPGLRQRQLKVAKGGITAPQTLIEQLTRLAPSYQPADCHPFHSVVSLGMGRPHIAAAHHQHPQISHRVSPLLEYPGS